MANNYLVEDAKNCPPFAGAGFYGTIFTPNSSINYFKERAWGLYDWGLGFEVVAMIKDSLPALKKHSTPAQIASYEKLFEVSPLISNVDEYVIAPMYGYKNAEDYWN